MFWRKGSSAPTVWRAVCITHLQSFAIAACAVSIPGSDAAGQNAFHCAGVERVEDVGTHSKFPQAPDEKEALLCLLQHHSCVSRPCEVLSDVHSKKLKAADPFHRCPVDDDGGVFSLQSPEIHHKLLGFVAVE